MTKKTVPVRGFIYKLIPGLRSNYIRFHLDIYIIVNSHNYG